MDERTGRFMNASLADYHVPVQADVPDIDAIWTGIPDSQAPLGLQGTGEIGITGVLIRDLPISPDKVLAGLCFRERTGGPPSTTGG